MKITIAQQIVNGLRVTGWVEGKRTTHYRTFTKEGRPTLYVGVAGALRFSHSHKVTQTGVVSSVFRERILVCADRYQS